MGAGCCGMPDKCFFLCEQLIRVRQPAKSNSGASLLSIRMVLVNLANEVNYTKRVFAGM
jgi:hypothetical protein